MSIIQEALKKVQKDAILRPDADKRRPPAHNIKLSIPLFIIFIALLAVIVQRSRPSLPKPTMLLNTPKMQVKDDDGAPQHEVGMPTLSFKPQHKDLILNGIMHLEDGPRAIINNSIVGEGDEVSGAAVVKIDKKSVSLKSDGDDIILHLR